MRVTDKFVFFFTHRDMFSNHFKHKNPILMDGFKFYTVEHAMMYEKALLFNDAGSAQRIATAQSPVDAKAIGRQVKGFDNDVWDKHKMQLVSALLFRKMKANPDIMEKALEHRSVGRIFVEASPYDAIWGVRLCEDDPFIDDPSKWKGQNLLGSCWEYAIDLVLERQQEVGCD